MMLISTPAIATKNAHHASWAAALRGGPVIGPVRKANEAPPDASLHRCRSRPALRFQRPIARRAPQTPRATRLPFACQLSMTVPIRSVLASGLLANYSMQASIRLRETRRTRAAGSGRRNPLTPNERLYSRYVMRWRPEAGCRL